MVFVRMAAWEREATPSSSSAHNIEPVRMIVSLKTGIRNLTAKQRIVVIPAAQKTRCAAPDDDPDSRLRSPRSMSAQRMLQRSERIQRAHAERARGDEWRRAPREDAFQQVERQTVQRVGGTPAARVTRQHVRRCEIAVRVTRLGQ